MEIQAIIKELAKNHNVFKGLLDNVSEDFYRWKPEPHKWSLLEIVCHLIDEEREDFRARVQHVLEKPQEEMIPFYPEKLVAERAYATQNYQEKLTEFLNERKISGNWLRQLQNPHWENEVHHPFFGAMSAKLFLTNWLAHDYLHIRQIIRYKYLYTEQQTQIDLQYAGRW